jgi:F-type H+-transporting ATPase subunit b
MNVFSLFAVDPAESPHWLFPEPAEIIYGGIASLVIFSALYKFALPQFKKALAARTERIQKELDASSNDLAQAQADAAKIRQALGDIASEKARLMADAQAQADALLTEGRSRLTAEVADMEAKADADIAAAAARGSDELRTEIGRLATVATDRVIASVLDDSTQQSLVENFIAKVGASR